MNLFLEKQKIKFVEKLKTERIKTQMNNKNVIHLLGKKQKAVIQLYHEEIQFFVLFGLSSPWSKLYQKEYRLKKKDLLQF